MSTSGPVRAGDPFLTTVNGVRVAADRPVETVVRRADCAGANDFGFGSDRNAGKSDQRIVSALAPST